MGVPWTEMDETRTNEYVADLTNRPKCALCQDAGVRIYKKDHCRRCYDLIRKEDRLKKKIRNLTGMTQGQAFEVKFDLSVTRKAIQLTNLFFHVVKVVLCTAHYPVLPKETVASKTVFPCRSVTVKKLTALPSGRCCQPTNLKVF